jgi:hypothetical protein
VWTLRGREAAEAALDYVAPVGERALFIASTLQAVQPYVVDAHSRHTASLRRRS